jgi:tetratricopeptide (TPR) repeat protein
MDPKDAINYTLSSMAVVMSSSAFLFAVVFQRKERKRNIRQTLTNSLNEIAKINVELSKFAKENALDDIDKITVRKNYNSQRSILITDADFLIHENYKIVTATDCSLLASTYSAIGYFEKADHFWRESIAKSTNAMLKHINMRDYASFLFQQDHFEKARKQFEKTLHVKLGTSDEELICTIDTYLTWAKLEHSFGEEEAFKKLIGHALEINKKIKHANRQTESKSTIETLRKNKPKADHPTGEKGKTK